MQSLSFDARNEKVIQIGDSGVIGVTQAKRAAGELKKVFDVVLAQGYIVENLVTSVATARSIDALAPDNPFASELASLRELIEGLTLAVTRIQRSTYNMKDTESMRDFIAEQARSGTFTQEDLEILITADTSDSFDRWVAKRIESIPAQTQQGWPTDEEPF